jgi:uncharacterized membrane protein
MGIDSTTYKIFLILHVIAVVVAFGPLFLYPSLRRNGETTTIARLHVRLTLPALVLVWVIGMGLAGLSDQTWELSQTWLSLSIVNWVALLAVSWFLIRPSLEDASETARSRLAAGIGITHVLLVVGLYLMVFKPGL